MPEMDGVCIEVFTRLDKNKTLKQLIDILRIRIGIHKELYQMESMSALRNPSSILKDI